MNNVKQIWVVEGFSRLLNEQNVYSRSIRLGHLDRLDFWQATTRLSRQ